MLEARPDPSNEGRATFSMASLHYVYQLLDPKNDLPFYVGKGQGRRAWSHEAQVRRGDLSGNARKVAKVKQIVDRGESVAVKIVAEYEAEADAFDHEIELISLDPTLTNIMPGGGALRLLSAAEVERRQKARKVRLDRLEAERVEREKQRITAFNVRRGKEFFGYRGAEKHQNEIAKWLDAIPPATSARTLSKREKRHSANLKRPIKLTPSEAQQLRSEALGRELPDVVSARSKTDKKYIEAGSTFRCRVF